ncbi:Resolvase, N terminal domain [Leifsonia sp. CL147]|nr:Resolvase, N terminal domain [Leifsonia sp. CL154]SFL64544.1 Resolvase, N terminal domain [Leifsonia sp. CL147]
MLIGGARVSTYANDLTTQRNTLRDLGVDEDNIHVDHGLTGTKRVRPGLREAVAAVRAGDTHVVAKLDRLARFPAGRTPRVSCVQWSSGRGLGAPRVLIARAREPPPTGSAAFQQPHRAQPSGRASGRR